VILEKAGVRIESQGLSTTQRYGKDILSGLVTVNPWYPWVYGSKETAGEEKLKCSGCV
jgi:hypothetical protein